MYIIKDLRVGEKVSVNNPYNNYKTQIGDKVTQIIDSERFKIESKCGFIGVLMNKDILFRY